MGKTVESAKIEVFDMADTVSRLKREITALTKQRSDLGRFMKIDQEKSELMKVRASLEKVKKKAESDAMNIVSRAKKEADAMLAKASEDAEKAKKYSAGLVSRAVKKLASATEKEEGAEKIFIKARQTNDKIVERISDLDKKELNLRKRIKSFMTTLNKFLEE